MLSASSLSCSCTVSWDKCEYQKNYSSHKEKGPKPVAMFALQRAIVGIQKWFDLYQYTGNQSAVAHV